MLFFDARFKINIAVKNNKKLHISIKYIWRLLIDNYYLSVIGCLRVSINISLFLQQHYLKFY